ncbi:hypothetical protein EGW08_010072, partial [Elysia chlorotica]
ISRVLHLTNGTKTVDLEKSAFVPEYRPSQLFVHPNNPLDLDLGFRFRKKRIKAGSSKMAQEYSSLQEDDRYPFRHGRGLAVIIIDGSSIGQGGREGSEKDSSMLQHMFTRLGFKLEVFENYNSQALLESLSRVSSEDFSEIDCLAVAISTHGGEGRTDAQTTEDFISTSGTKIKTSVILQMFIDEKCPTLVGKPRLFFLQACRGYLLDSGQEVQISSALERTVNLHTGTAQGPTRPMTRQDGAGSPVEMGIPLQEVKIRPVPCYKDFLVMYATPPGYFAFRNPDNGSRFINCLYQVMSNVDPSLNLTRCLTRVVAAVAMETSYCPVNAPSRHNKKQTPVIYSMLTKDLFLLNRK